MSWDIEAKEKFKAHLCCGTCKHLLEYEPGNLRHISTLMGYCPKRDEWEWLNQDWNPNDKCHWYEDCDNVEERIHELVNMG